MAQSITQYPRFPGTNSTCYEVIFVQNAQGLYVPTQKLITGLSPLLTDSGEIFIKLDWSAIANLGVSSPGISTSNIAQSAVDSILNPSFFPEMQGRSIVELPIHLIGHSRGGSVVSAMAELLGKRGIWVDHVTTLDPHPLNNDNFGAPPLVTIVDAPVRAWENILFFDNYWQTNPDLTVPNGEPVQGAYNRYVGPLAGGYNNAHMNVHLWYHGTLDLNNPATDSQANITSMERASWWTPYEQQGVVAGFYYSLVGHGDRLSNDAPVGSGTTRIRDGYNQRWDFGAGLATNRFQLPSNSGEWPNVIKFELAGTNSFTLPSGTRVYGIIPGLATTISTRMFFQYGGLPSANATVTVILGRDGNVYNPENIPVATVTYSATGSNVASAVPTLDFTKANVPLGVYYAYAKITTATHSRYLYAPQLVEVLPPLTLSGPVIATGGQVIIQISGIANEHAIIEASSDLKTWTTITTNALSATVTNALVGTASISDARLSSGPGRFYRAFYRQ